MTRRREIRHLWMLLPMLALAQSAAHAQTPAERLKTVLANPAAKAAAIEAGKKAATFCANCHGQDGNSKLPEVPNLAGQNPIYLMEQVRKFAAGERRDQWMEPAIKLLSETERVNIVAYYSAMTVIPASSAPPSAQGNELYHQLCTACHGQQAYGGERFPRLAGQQKGYLLQSLTRYRDRTGERMAPEMLAMTAKLKDADIKHLSEYLSTLR